MYVKSYMFGDSSGVFDFNNPPYGDGIYAVRTQNQINKPGPSSELGKNGILISNLNTTLSGTQFQYFFRDNLIFGIYTRIRISVTPEWVLLSDYIKDTK